MSVMVMRILFPISDMENSRENARISWLCARGRGGESKKFRLSLPSYLYPTECWNVISPAIPLSGLGHPSCFKNRAVCATIWETVRTAESGPR